jgi:hypothetical protein
VTDLPRACLVEQWDRCRWDIELFCRVLKPGCPIEQWRRQTEPRLRMVGRAYPEVSCEVLCEPREWQTLYTMQQHCHPPPTPPLLREMVRSLAQLGGFFTRRGDGEPGIKAIWQGYQRLHDFIDAIETYRTVHAGERNV